MISHQFYTGHLQIRQPIFLSANELGGVRDCHLAKTDVTTCYMLPQTGAGQKRASQVRLRQGNILVTYGNRCIYFHFSAEWYSEARPTREWDHKISSPPSDATVVDL